MTRGSDINHTNSGTLRTVFGISASGKDTLINSLCARYPTRYSKVLNDTTRKPRQNEIDFVDYHFISEETYLSNVANGSYFTMNSAHGRSYGVTFDAIEKPWREGKIPLGHFGMQDHLRLWRSKMQVKTIGLIPPSYDEWSSRMLTRIDAGLIDEAELLKRRALAANELGFLLFHGATKPIVLMTSDSDILEQANNYYFGNGEVEPFCLSGLYKLIKDFDRHSK